MRQVCFPKPPKLCVSNVPLEPQAVPGLVSELMGIVDTKHNISLNHLPLLPVDLLDGLLREDVEGVQIGGEFLHGYDALDLAADTFISGRT